jgi:RHS repeat-associated protein
MAIAYDGDSNRIKVTKGTTTTVYIGGIYEATYVSGSLTITKKYYAFGGQVVAMKDNGTLYYLHGDHLGSTSLTTNSSGAVVSVNSYYPFGTSRFTNGTRPTAKDFTGQLLDGTGLHFYNARYDDSVIGRFISADTIVPEPRPVWFKPLVIANSDPN